MYNTNYKCVKPFDVWLDAIGPDGKKIPYRVKRGTIWRLVWCGGEQNFKEFTGPDKMHITLPDEYVEKYFKKWWQEFPLIHVGDELPHLVKCCEVSILIKVVTNSADCKTKSRNKI